MASPDGPSLLKPFRLHMVAGAAVAAVLLAVSLAIGSNEPTAVATTAPPQACVSLPPLPGEVPTVAEVVASFKGVVFGLDWGGAPRLVRWLRTMRVYAPALPPDRAGTVTDVLTRLSCLTGVRMSLTEEKPRLWQYSYVILVFSDADEVLDRFIESHETYSKEEKRRLRQEWSKKKATCVPDAKWSSFENRIVTGTIAIADDLSMRAYTRCVHETFATLLGAVADLAVVPDSILRDDPNQHTLSIHDAILVRLLYDRSIRPGMGLMTTMYLVRKRAETLLRNLRSKGQAILYRAPE